MTAFHKTYTCMFINGNTQTEREKRVAHSILIKILG